MRFYTNVQMVGDHFLVRGYEDGKHFATREKFYPTLFVDSKRKTKYKTLDGLPVEPIEPGTVRECRDFIKIIMKLKTLMSMVTKDISINTYLRSTQKSKLSLIQRR